MMMLTECLTSTIVKQNRVINMMDFRFARKYRELMLFHDKEPFYHPISHGFAYRVIDENHLQTSRWISDPDLEEIELFLCSIGILIPSIDDLRFIIRKTLIVDHHINAYHVLWHKRGIIDNTQELMSCLDTVTADDETLLTLRCSIINKVYEWFFYKYLKTPSYKIFNGRMIKIDSAKDWW